MIAPAGLAKHDGPGPHDNGSPQDVHGGEGGGERTKEMEAGYKAWYDEMGFNKNDHAALEAYIGADYQDINESLRSGYDLGEYEDEVVQLDDITTWAEAKENLTVYRGMPLYGADTDDPGIRSIRSALEKKMKNPSARVTFLDRAFLSTSLDQATAEDFALYEGEDANPALIVINVPKGTKCAPINPNELEVLFPRESRFEITSVQKDGGYWRVEMTPVKGVE